MNIGTYIHTYTHEYQRCNVRTYHMHASDFPSGRSLSDLRHNNSYYRDFDQQRSCRAAFSHWYVSIYVFMYILACLHVSYAYVDIMLYFRTLHTSSQTYFRIHMHASLSSQTYFRIHMHASLSSQTYFRIHMHASLSSQTYFRIHILQPARCVCMCVCIYTHTHTPWRAYIFKKAFLTHCVFTSSTIYEHTYGHLQYMQPVCTAKDFGV
jgi:hypothetical protein